VAHTGQSMPDSGLGCQVKVLKRCYGVPPSPAADADSERVWAAVEVRRVLHTLAHSHTHTHTLKLGVWGSEVGGWVYFIVQPLWRECGTYKTVNADADSERVRATVDVRCIRFRVWGFKARGLGMGVYGLWFGGWGFRFRVQGSGFGVSGFRFRVQGSGFGGWGFRFRVQGLGVGV